MRVAARACAAIKEGGGKARNEKNASHCGVMIPALDPDLESAFQP